MSRTSVGNLYGKRTSIKSPNAPVSAAGVEVGAGVAVGTGVEVGTEVSVGLAVGSGVEVDVASGARAEFNGFDDGPELELARLFLSLAEDVPAENPPSTAPSTISTIIVPAKTAEHFFNGNADIGRPTTIDARSRF